MLASKASGPAMDSLTSQAQECNASILTNVLKAPRRVVLTRFVKIGVEDTSVAVFRGSLHPPVTVGSRESLAVSIARTSMSASTAESAPSTPSVPTPRGATAAAAVLASSLTTPPAKTSTNASKTPHRVAQILSAPTHQAPTAAAAPRASVPVQKAPSDMATSAAKESPSNVGKM